MKNSIAKTLTHGEQVRFYFVDNTQLLHEIFELNNKIPLSLKLLLGKTVSVMSILSGTLKGNQRMSLQITLSNPKYKIFAEAEANGNVRGYLNESLLTAPGLEEQSMEDLIGSTAMISVIKGSDMSQFTSITDMPNQNIVDDIANYFVQSDQTPTYLHSTIQFDDQASLLSSHALFAQLLPGAPPQLLSEVKNAIKTNPEIFSKLKAEEASDNEEELRRMFGSAKVIGYSSSQFFCGCTKEMFYGMLYSLSEEEIKRSIEEDEDIEAFCHICGKTYTFQQKEIEHLL
ncbi:Hsp33 family molecular chaperone HslO [Salinicoccus roseus]|uniref:Hsp33 family molecular chaperone HslO n=1 Tax=Salinicoccus roseus TaxID=45670 RepID=UPI001EF60289|nr:Hsp33 family molecular chaperone HslO [Salinicoccus roseus]MCG7332288.1 Hsp33 family molecular chaperone HslO [Salinicoccus roseus]